MEYDRDIFTNYFEKGNNSPYFRVHRGNQESYADMFMDLLPPDRDVSILEIGCGAGQLLYCLRDNGYKNIEGVDLGEEQVRYLKDMGIKGEVILSIPQYLQNKKNRYDAILLSQVMEHFTKDELWRNLRSIYDSLKPGGIFIFATPNMACLSAPFQRYIDFTHEVGFTERSAFQVMRIAGFKDILIRGDRIRWKFRLKRIAWWILNKLWYSLLGFLYYIERGNDRPRILSRHLVIKGKKL